MQREKQQVSFGRFALRYVLPFFITAIILVLALWRENLYPFGESSIASMDASIQYLDFFSYLKDVFSGENSIAYTFGKTLGGTNIAVFSYYLSSPFNLLLFFFQKSSVLLFFTVTVILKLGTAATTMAVFLEKRFEGKLHACIAVLLSVSYALMQYSIAQASNIMWLDGVYMLPLMMLGVYRLVHDKTCKTLIFSTGLSILFNWYIGAVSCLFSVIWLVLEYLLMLPEEIENAKTLRNDTFRVIGRYAISMIAGVLLSSALFVPTLVSLASGGRGTVDWSLMGSGFKGNIWNLVQGFTIGAASSEGRPALYCGSLALLGCIGFFVSKKTGRNKKIKVGVVLFGTLMILYWRPLCFLFSLLKEADSYWYRYSYGVIFLILFIAAQFFLDMQGKERGQSGEILLRCAIAYAGLLLFLQYLNDRWDIDRVYLTCGFLVIIALLLMAVFSTRFSRRKLRMASVVLTAVLGIELLCNTGYLMTQYSSHTQGFYPDYAADQQAQIDALKAYDGDTYRISQTMTFDFEKDTLITANYNEALAYNYMSIAGYTSDPDNLQRTLLDALGYRINGENFSIVNTSVIGTDSLLGVKYILSPVSINGLQEVTSLGTYNEKKVYENPYALPMAFTIEGTEADPDPSASTNPFTYQNAFYSALLGEEVELYVPVSFAVEESSDSRSYTLMLPDGNYAVYGNIPWSARMYATIRVNDAYEAIYSQWDSQSVFYIPTDEGDASATVTLAYEEDYITDEQFYALDLDLLEEISARLTEGEPEYSLIENGHAEFRVNGTEGAYLFTSIPYNQGWTITVNGREVEPKCMGDCLMSVPLQEGVNEIVMVYHVPYLTTGVLISIVTLAGVILVSFWFRRKKKCY